MRLCYKWPLFKILAIRNLQNCRCMRSFTCWPLFCGKTKGLSLRIESTCSMFSKKFWRQNLKNGRIRKRRHGQKSSLSQMKLLYLDIAWGQQKLGLILENIMFENWSYKKVSESIFHPTTRICYEYILNYLDLLRPKICLQNDAQHQSLKNW